MSMWLVGACAHDDAAKKTETPAAEQQQPAAAGPEAQQPTAAPAPAPAPGSAPTVATPPRPRDTTFTVQGQQDPNPDTQAAMRSLRGGNYEQAIAQAKLALGKNERFVPHVARMRTLPLAMCGATPCVVTNISEICPLIRSVWAGVVPL